METNDSRVATRRYWTTDAPADPSRCSRGVGGHVRYVGEFVVDETVPFIWDHAPETGGGPLRTVVRFRLQPARVARQSVARETRTYRRANEHPQTESADPFERDPNEVDRSLAAHARTQNALRDFLMKRRCEVWSAGPGEPDFDLAWERKGIVWVGEVKSLAPGNDARQLRLGLGQVLDYQDSMLLRHPTVRAALALSAPPAERRWVDLCLRHSVVLVWPGTFEEVLR